MPNISEEQVREEAKRIISQNPNMNYGYADCDQIDFTSGNLRYWVRHNLIITRRKNKTAAEERNKEYTLDEFMQTENIFKPEIKKLASLLSSPTLQEKVEVLLNKLGEFYNLEKCTQEMVCFSGVQTECKLTHNQILTINEGETEIWSIDEYESNVVIKDIYKEILPKIAALLSPTEPTLQEQIAELDRACSYLSEMVTEQSRRADEWFKNWEGSVVNGKESVQRIIQLESERETEDEKWAKAFKILKDKNLALEEQLQGCVSQADHEKEIADLLRTIDEQEEKLATCEPESDSLNDLIVRLVTLSSLHDIQMLDRSYPVARPVTS